MCVCVCVCMYVCACVCVCVCLFACVCVCVHSCAPDALPGLINKTWQVFYLSPLYRFSTQPQSLKQYGRSLASYIVQVCALILVLLVLCKLLHVRIE